MKKNASLILLIFFNLSVINCSETQPEETSKIRIEIGKGVDGIYFGDSEEKVISILGSPDNGGIADGINWSWYFSEYNEGKYAGLTIYFLEEPINAIGPVDIITIRSPYSGETESGIKIGSSVSDVMKIYGEPKAIYGNTSEETYTFVYCINRKRLQISFRGDQIEGIGLGYYKIPPDYECL